MQIDVNENSSIPKYRQIVDSIINNIIKGHTKSGDRLPSINVMSEDYYLSRDTVEKAYKVLRERKIIESIKGKGYYITDIIPDQKVNILFMINKPSGYKMEIYDAFVNEIGGKGHVSMFLYYCDETLFINELEKKMGAFDYYVVMLHFRDENSKHISFTEKVLHTLNKIPKDRVILIDNYKSPLNEGYGCIYQDFEKDISESLTEALEKLKKYEKLVLVYPSKVHYPYPRRIARGFTSFCMQNHFNYEVIEEIYDDMELDKKYAYIILREKDLVSLVRQVRGKNLQLGKDIGIISYNETPLKDLLGITVISTDFKAMGGTAGYMVLKNKRESVKNVFKYIERDSL